MSIDASNCFDDLYERVTDKKTGTVAHRYYVYGRERMVATVTRIKGRGRRDAVRTR